jgi:hypothetical protein
MGFLYQAVLVIFFAMTNCIAANAQALVEDPVPVENRTALRVSVPKVSPKSSEVTSFPKTVLREPWWKLDRDVTALGMIHGAASLMDGITTRKLPNTFMEGDPLDRLFLGPTPTWSRMIPLGALEIFGTAFLAQRMKHSRWKVARRLYVAPQIVLTGLHTYAGGHNVVQTNNYYVRGY